MISIIKTKKGVYFMCDVFISYKSEESADAIWLEQVLEKNGISCWIAPDNIPGGSNYGYEIPKAIESCKIFVLVLSDKAQKSMWISKEVNMALNYKKIIMPFMIEDCELLKEFNFYLSDVQRYSAYESKAKAIEQMIAEIKRILNNDPISTKPISTKPIPTKPITPNQKPSNKFDVFALITLSYLLCIPGGIITTISYLLELSRWSKNYKITKTLCILAILVGVFFFTVATVRYSHCNEAYYISVPGLIIELILGGF